jgi:hypothetical protein
MSGETKARIRGRINGVTEVSDWMTSVDNLVNEIQEFSRGSWSNLQILPLLPKKSVMNSTKPGNGDTSNSRNSNPQVT